MDSKKKIEPQCGGLSQPHHDLACYRPLLRAFPTKYEIHYELNTHNKRRRLHQIFIRLSGRAACRVAIDGHGSNLSEHRSRGLCCCDWSPCPSIHVQQRPDPGPCSGRPCRTCGPGRHLEGLRARCTLENSGSDHERGMRCYVPSRAKSYSPP